MIGVIFDFGGQVVEVRIDKTNCLFRTTQFGGAFAGLENLHLDKKGVIKEFPDLEGREDWRVEAIKRFNEKLSNMKTEEERMDYVVEDLKKFGYKPMYKQKQGFRPEKFK